MDFLFVVFGASHSIVIGGCGVIELLSGLLLRLFGSVRIYESLKVVILHANASIKKLYFSG